jgi:indolepyruvate ferredoxin oxidoreductase alpha subunit
VLCPSFYRARIVTNPSRWERWRAQFASAVIGWLAPPTHA